MPYDPKSNGRSESSVQLAKADTVPTSHNRLPAYQSFGELEAACSVLMTVVNNRVHHETCARPDDRLAIEQAVCTRSAPKHSRRCSGCPARCDVVVHDLVA